MEGLVLGIVGVKMRIHQVICTSRDQETPALHILKQKKMSSTHLGIMNNTFVVSLGLGGF